MSVVSSALDAYASFTDAKALRDASLRPLRPSLRVNTLKTSVEDLKKRAVERGWRLTPVPWAPEGFFVEGAGEGDLGRDTLHRLGHYYLQEAASMLPARLLDPKPGDAVLDLCAAPGSKTTQLAALMSRIPDEGGQKGEKGHPPSPRLRRTGEGQKSETSGVIVANDPQERRLWILQTALQRVGAMNVIVTKRPGESFSRMTERFDRVLCDAPCTAMGSSRRDPEVLKRVHPSGVAKLAGTQARLLEAAVHAAKVGGRIVYSTCTLTLEENEAQMVALIRKMNKFSVQLRALDPAEILQVPPGTFDAALEDSAVVQKSLGITSTHPFLRFWPHRYDTEGFFIAVLEKIALTKTSEKADLHPAIEKPLSRTGRDRVTASISDQFGTSFLRDDEILFGAKDQLSFISDSAASFFLPFPAYACGLPYAKIRDGKPRLSHEMVTLRGSDAKKNIHEISNEDFAALFRGQKIECPTYLRGDQILTREGIVVGLGTAGEGRLQSRFPKAYIQ